MCSDEVPFKSRLICCNQPAICSADPATPANQPWPPGSQPGTWPPSSLIPPPPSLLPPLQVPLSTFSYPPPLLPHACGCTALWGSAAPLTTTRCRTGFHSQVWAQQPETEIRINAQERDILGRCRSGGHQRMTLKICVHSKEGITR